MIYNCRLPFSSSFIRLLTLIAALGAWSNVSHANSMVASTPNPYAAATAGVAPLLSATAPGSERFFAVGLMRKTRGLAWECTATLVANSETPNDDQAALILTAGHCSVDPLVAIDNADNDVIIDKPMAVGFVFIPAYFFDNIDEHHEYAIKRIVYSSMKGSEIGLLELAATYGELRSRGVKPVRLKNFEATDQNIELAHIPQGAFPGGFFLRHSMCQSQPPTPVFESAWPIRRDLPWYWSDSRANDCVGVYGGSSGAPVFAKEGKRVIGVLSTGTDSHLNGCGFARPCELTANGPVSRPEAVYTNAVDHILAAFRADNTLDLSKLDPGTGVVIERMGAWSTRSEVPNEQGQLQPASWDLKISNNVEWIRYKTGLASSIRCALPKGYGAPVKADEQPLLKLGVGQREGILAICVIGKRFGQTSWQSMKFATAKLRQLDNTGPQIEPNVQIFDHGDDNWQIITASHINEIVEVHHKYGALKSIDCASESGYSLVEEPLTLPKERDWHYCAYGTDEAGNRSLIVSKELTIKTAIN